MLQFGPTRTSGCSLSTSWVVPEVLSSRSENSQKILRKSSVWPMSEEIGRLGGSKTIRDTLIVSGETADRNKRETYEFGPFRAGSRGAQALARG